MRRAIPGQHRTAQRVTTLENRRQLAQDVLLMASDAVVSGSAGGTTTSATFANFPDSTDIAFTQTVESQKVCVHVDLTCYTTAANTVVEFRVLFSDGSASGLKQLYFTGTAGHTAISFSRVVTLSATVGARTARLQWRRVSGAGTLTTDTADGWSVVVL